MSRSSRRRARMRRRAVMAALGCCVVAALVWDVARLNAEKTLEDATGSMLYPERSGLTFDHRVHAGTACKTCHAPAFSSQRAADDLMPSMDVCASCHTEAEPKLETCSGCHVAYPIEVDVEIKEAADWRAVRPAPMPVARPESRLRFDHSVHVKEAVASGVQGDALCTSCHATTETDRRAMPSKPSCMACHDGESASDECTVCHIGDALAKRVVRTEFSTADSNPVSPEKSVNNEPKRSSKYKSNKEKKGTALLRPDNHEVDWLARHGAVAKSNGLECASCHREEDCATCHTERVAKPWQMHPPNYVTIHAVDARTSMGRCTDCHTVDNFCVSCHVRSGVATIEGGKPPARVEFHPSGWLDASMPNNHGVMARRNINDCASCHVENDCVSCHTGINPHGPEFTLNCGSFLKSNPRTCVKCHTDMASIRTLCR